MSNFEYKRSVSKGNVSINTPITFNTQRIVGYEKKVEYNIAEFEKKDLDTINLDELLTSPIEGVVTTNTSETVTNPNSSNEFFENLDDTLASTAATVAVATTSVVSGVLDVGEAVFDGLTWLTSKVVGLVSPEGEEAMKEFIARDLVSEANEAFYENTEIGRAINDASYMKYDSEVAQGIRTVTEDITVFAAATALTVCTGGAAAPLTLGIGAAYGLGTASEDTYAIAGTDTSTIQELLILGNGALSALSWYTSGKLGKGFIEIGKSMAEAGVKEILAEMCKGIFSKEMLKELFKPGNIVGNAIATLMQAGGDIGRIATTLYNGGEVSAEEWALLIGELITYFGLNIAEDALRTEIINFNAPKPLDVETPNIEKTTDDGLEKTAELHVIKEELEKTLELPVITIQNLEDDAGQKLFDFSHRWSVPKDYFYTDEGKDIYSIYEVLKKVSFEEFNARYPNVFFDEDDYLDAISAIKTTKLSAIMNIIADERSLTPEMFKDVEDYLFDRGTYEYINQDEFAFLKKQIDGGLFTLNPRYEHVYEQLCKKIELINSSVLIKSRLEEFAGAYVSRERTESILNSFELKVDTDFARSAKEASWAGYNNGAVSVINLKYTMAEIEDIMSHESVHHISHNTKTNFDPYTGEHVSIAGVSRSVYRNDQWIKENEGINESLTEFFHILSHGEGYKKTFTSGYQAGVDVLEIYVEKGLINIEDLKRLYFTNDTQGIIKYFDDISKKYNIGISGIDVIKAFDDAALNTDNKANGLKTLNRFLKEYQKSIDKSSTISPIKLLEKFKEMFGL